MLPISSAARSVAVAAICATIAAPAIAGAPPMSLNITAGSSSVNESLVPSSVSSGVGIYSGTFNSPGAWNVSANFNAFSELTTVGSTVTGAQAWHQGTIAISNLSQAEVTYVVSLSLPTNVTQPMTGAFQAQVSGSLIANTGGGRLRTVAPQALWTATTGSTLVGTLFQDPFEVARTSAGSTTLGSRSFGSGTPVSTPVFGDSVTMTFVFTLTAGDSASFSTSLSGIGTAVPAPSALALAGLAGLGMRRRRR